MILILFWLLLQMLALEYASDRLKNDKDIVLVAVKQDRRVLKYVSAKLKEDMEQLNMVLNKNKAESKKDRKNRPISVTTIGLFLKNSSIFNFSYINHFAK